MNSRARLIKAVDNSACLTRRQINDYIAKKLYPEELYVVEMHLNECPFCNDAIEGFQRADNANQLLSEIDTLQIPAVTAAAPPPPEKPAPPPAVVVAPPVQPAAAPATAPQPKAKSSNTRPFEEPNSRKGGFWKIGLAAAVLLGAGIWGISKISNKDHVTGNGMLAENATTTDNAADAEVPPVSAKEDSAMNARYGYQSQEPAAAIARTSPKPATEPSADSAPAAADEAADIAMATTSRTAPAAAATTRSTPSAATTTTAPVIAKADVSKSAKTAAYYKESSDLKKAAPEAKYEYQAPNSSASTKSAGYSVTQNKAADVSNRYTTTTKAEKVRPSAKTADERNADVETRRREQAQKATLQATADYKKGLELYNKKQYSSALLYFQSVAKVSSSPNQKQAANYVTLCKKKITEAEQAKKSKDTKKDTDKKTTK